MSSQTASKSGYTDVPLNSEPNVIRLLEILDDKAGPVGNIACKFHRVRLDNAPAYTALSYTWGPANEASKILIGGTWFSVRQNVWNFFQQTRIGRRWKFIWIDALCIDQNNPVERNYQVNMMRAIYSSVDIVTVWLGEAADDSDMAMQYIGRLDKGPISAQRPCNWKQGRAVYALTERRYWKRIWIVQEIMLAKDIIVLCGQKSATWPCFSTLLDQLQNIQQHGRMEHIPFAWQVFDSAALRIVSKRQTWRALPQETKGLPIEGVLEDFADLESTELKDKVYALLGIIQPFADGSTLLVDYSKTTAAVYRDVLRHFFYHDEGLDLPSKQHFKKLLKKSLGLGVINVMEREPRTEARILIAVEDRAQTIIESIATKAVERFHSRESDLCFRLVEKVETILDNQGGGRVISRLSIATYEPFVPQVAHAIAAYKEMRSFLFETIQKELTATMANAEPNLLGVCTNYLKDSGELGVETTMRWVEESRFEVESDRDKVLDSKMELRMMDILNTHISRHVEPSIQSAIDSALKTAENSVFARVRQTDHESASRFSG